MSAIRALAEDLMQRSDDQLRGFLRARPDLVQPPVPDFAALAARASTRVSIVRALEHLTEPQLDVLQAVELTTSEDSQLSTTAAWLKSHLGGSTVKSLDSILDALHKLALIRRAPAHPGTPKADQRRRFYLPVPSLQEALGPYPAGLGRPYATLAATNSAFGAQLVHAVARLRSEGFALDDADSPATAAYAMQHWICEPAHWAALLVGAPEGTTALLERFTTSPVGTLPRTDGSSTDGSTTDGSTSVRWLLERCLLAPLDTGHVELPRAVGQAARGHLIISSLRLDPPTPRLDSTSVALRDNAANASVAETLRLVTELLTAVENAPIATLRSGGVGVREVRRLAETLRIPPTETAWLLELAAMASLLVLNVDTSRWTMTPGVTAQGTTSAGATGEDGGWQQLDRHEQWSQLVRAWYSSPRAPALIGVPIPAGGTVNALAAEASRPDAPHVRASLLGTLAELDRLGRESAALADGSAPALTAAAAIDRLSWHQPRLRRRFTRLLPGMLAEAGHLGLLGSAALTQLGGLVAQERYDDAAQALAKTLPDALSHFVLQADLTAVAPGYLEPAVTRELALISIPEGQGPAAVYRFSDGSIRTGLDAGKSAESILTFLSQHSSTPVPQPLRYLVEDTAMRHGRLRVGQAGSYLRSDHEHLLTDLLADARTAALGLERLAPTVVVSRASANELTSTLRSLGYTTSRDPHANAPMLKSPARRNASTSSDVHTNAWELSEDDVDAQLRTLRGAGAPPAAGTAESEQLIGLETLRKAIRLKRRVRIGVVDRAGNQRQEELVPLSVSGGRVRVFDPAREIEHVVSVHRVMDVELLEPPGGTPTHG